MAFDINVFKTRALSAVIFGAIMLAGLLGGKILFIAVFALIVFMAAREYFMLQSTIMQKPIVDTAQLMYAAAATLFFVGIAEQPTDYFFSIADNTSLIYFGGTFFVLLLVAGSLLNKKLFLVLLLGLIYIPFSLGLLAQCYRVNNMLPLILLVLIWINDTMQYIVGANFGKTKMAPIISPKKTWEGTIGGSVLCIIVAIIWGLLSKQFNIGVWIGIGLAATIVGTLGDLTESKLKRTAGVKDSGNIMPGHGGALDRFDSLLLAAPVLWLVVKLFGLG
jgi:phosphatidate cytidylyltransferase